MNAYGGILVVAIVCLSLTWFPLGTLAYELTFEVPYKVHCGEEEASSELQVGKGKICRLGVEKFSLKCTKFGDLSTSHNPPAIGIAIVQNSETKAKIVYFNGGEWPSKTVAAILGPEDKPSKLSFSKRFYSSYIKIKPPAHPGQKISFENGKNFFGPIYELRAKYLISNVIVEQKDFRGRVTETLTEVNIEGTHSVSNEIRVYTVGWDGQNIKVLPSDTDLKDITKKTKGIALVLKKNGRATLKSITSLKFPLTRINNVVAMILKGAAKDIITGWRKRSAVFHFRDYELTFPLKKKITNITFSPKDLDQDAFLRLKRLHPIRYNQDQAKLLRQWVYPKPRESDADYANRLVKSWKRAGIEVVAFDFDGTLIADNVNAFDEKLTHHAEKLIQACWDNKVGVWIASNRDNLDEHHVEEDTYAEPPPSRTPVKIEVQSPTLFNPRVTVNCYWPTVVAKTGADKSLNAAYLMTYALATSKLKFDNQHRIGIVTFLPDKSRPGSDVYNSPDGNSRPKIIHLQRIARIANVKNGKVMLIDDSLENVESVVKYGFVGAHVSNGNGIVMDNLTAVSP